MTSRRHYRSRASPLRRIFKGGKPATPATPAEKRAAREAAKVSE